MSAQERAQLMKNDMRLPPEAREAAAKAALQSPPSQAAPQN
jgi:hypothetical protein